MLKKAVERGTLPISLDLETEFASVKYDGIPHLRCNYKQESV